MASQRRNTDGVKSSRPPQPPATTPEARENQLISLATDLVEKQMREGTASSQVITHYLKAGSGRERIERQKLEAENDLLRKKIEEMGTAKRVEELYESALSAMRGYSGERVPDDRYDD